jgi:site-specific recombinase XerD
MTAAELPWPRLRYEHTSAVRAALVTRYAPATVNQALAALRGVLREAARLGLLSAEDLARACDLKPAKGSRLPAGRALEPAELRQLLDACDLDTAGGARDAALLALAYNCGMRRAELVALDLAHYDAAKRQLRVLGKGNKERPAYVTAAAEALDRWLARRGCAPGPLFLPVNSAERIGARRLTDQAVLYLLGRLAERAGVATFSPHDIRRTFIGDLLDLGADISVVQQLAGHALVTTTQRYDRRGEAAKKKAARLLRL